MGRRIPTLVATAVLAFAILPVAPASAGERTSGDPGGTASWAQAQIEIVLANGLMAAGTGTTAAFRPNDPLTRGALDHLVTGLQAELQRSADGPGGPEPTTTTTTTVATTTNVATTTAATPAAQLGDPNAPVTMAQLDARLVRALGLSRAAAAFARGARAAGLQVPGRFGTEAVARLLGLRASHSAGQDGLELLPGDSATRAEAAYSAARILGLDGGEAAALETMTASFQLPQLTVWQRAILDTAVRFIGYPYVWGGTSERTQTILGATSRGGFDCSGFIWRVYKLQSYPGEGDLADTLRGRTTFELSGEVPRTQRVPLAGLQPGDVLFWGARGPRSKPTQIDHTGIYLGSGWFIHSSDHGVALARLQGWYLERFAWARRPLAEAGLE